jgi:predicted nucleic acid-binding protein
VNGAVLVDTNVFTARLRNDRRLERQYGKHTAGKRVVVTPQTVAEARYGALAAGWGVRRASELDRLIAHVGVLEVDGETTEAVAQVRNQCRLIGHALHQRLHKCRPVDRRGRDPVGAAACCP